MTSYRTIKPKNPHDAKTANDVHITSYDPAIPKPAQTPKLNLKGFNGKRPDDPTAEYQAGGDGSDTIDVSDINVGTGGEVNIRLQSDQDPFPPVWVQWTKDGNKLGGANVSEKFAMAGGTGSGAESATLASVHQIINLATSLRETLVRQG